MQVYNATRQASPRRAVIAAVVLFAFSLSLAATMSWHRAAQPLGELRRPDGWGLSFRSPRGWREGKPDRLGPTTAFPFHGLTRSGKRATLAVWRLGEMPDADPAQICALILGQSPTPSTSERTTSPVATSAARLGAFDGDELFDSRNQTVVRAALGPNGNAYAVSCWVRDEVIDAHTYNLFDLTCRSIKFDGE